MLKKKIFQISPIMIENLKITSLNCKQTGITNRILNTITQNQDILCLQEIHLPNHFTNLDNLKIRINRLEHLWNSKIYLSKYSENKASLTIVKNTIIEFVDSFEELIPGRAMCLKVKNNLYEYNIVNIYAPVEITNKYKIFRDELLHKISSKQNIIPIGDWNFLEDKKMRNKANFSKEMKTKAKEWKKLPTNFIEVHKIFNTKLKYTFRIGDYQSRLDRIYIKPQNILDISNYDIIPNHFSDHDKITLTLKWNPKQLKWGKGVWKLNNTLLENEDYQYEIQCVINRFYLNNKILNPADNWDHVKKEIKTISIESAQEINRENIDKCKILQENLAIIQYNIEQGDNSQETYDKLIRVKKEISKQEQQKAQGQIIRSKEDKILYDAKSTKYFFKKEKRKGQQNQIDSLINNENKIIQDKEEIIKETESFYKDLYNKDNINSRDIDNVLDHIENKLEENEVNALNKDITNKEIIETIKSMNNDKSPGEDGLTKEFYEKFLNLLLPILNEVLNFTLKENIQPKSHKNALIKLLFKKGNSKLLKNWRPISLLNTDYKILSKILSNRLTAYMQEIVPTEQKCGVKNRQMTEIIRNIASYRDQAQTGFLVTLDQEKAFDRLSHTFLFKLLEKIGVKGHFLETIKTIYKNITSQVIINGRMTKKIHIKKGVRQGCPLSMILFVLGSIPLINMFKKNKFIKGHQTARNRYNKIQMYADDATVIIKDANELKHIFNTFKEFGKASGAKLNEEKTEILRLGKPSNNEDPKFQTKLRSEIKILGAYLSINKKNETELNLKKASETLEVLHRDKKYTKSLMGRILKVNTYVLQIIWTKAWLINTKSKAFNNFKEQIYKYIHD